MAYHTLEHHVTSMSGFRRPLYVADRVYRTKDDVMRRISFLMREYGAENVVSEPDRRRDGYMVVYVREY